MRICFSAGHGLGSRAPGRTDPGAQAHGIDEADFTRSLCIRLAHDFAALGYWTMLRDGGHYSLADDDAAKAMCDVFVEIHLNAANKTAHGTETLIHGNAPAGSSKLANAIQTRLVRALGTRDRGVRQRSDLAVLKPHKGMKACLVEVFFLTSQTDLAKWRTNGNRGELAIVNGILASQGKRTVRSLPRKWGKAHRAIARRT